MPAKKAQSFIDHLAQIIYTQGHNPGLCAASIIWAMRREEYIDQVRDLLNLGELENTVVELAPRSVS